METQQFLGRPEPDVQTGFGIIDVNGSALIEDDEFLFSMIGEAVDKFGLLDDAILEEEDGGGVLCLA